jgi:lauroyl/myristoyl acyltransferase
MAPMVALIAYMTANLAVLALPERAANRLAVALARLAFALRVPARRRLESNLRLLLGKDDAITPRARESFEHFALSLVDFLRLGRMPSGTLAASIEIRGAEHLARAQGSGRGVILLSAHTGNWEWGAAYLGTLGERVHVAARPHPSRWVEAFFAGRRRRFGVTTMRGRPLWLAASRALRRREWVALMGDRPADGLRAGSGAGSLCAWAAALARRTGALVLPAVMLRLADGRYAACFEPPLEPEACQGGGYRRAMRRHLEAEPGQWFAFELLPDGLA